MEAIQIYKKLSQPPKGALREIKAGDLKGKTDINPQWRYEAMTETFGLVGLGWKYEIQKLWTAREKALRLEFQKIPAPSAGNADGPTITAEQFHAMGYLERVEFAQKNPEEYNKLMGR